MNWTLFFDMHSGGGRKTQYEYIVIESADQNTAKEVFQAEFGQDPDDEACSCCGPNYSISTGEDLNTLTEYWRKGATVEAWEAETRNRVKILRMVPVTENKSLTPDESLL